MVLLEAVDTVDNKVIKAEVVICEVKVAVDSKLVVDKVVKMVVEVEVEVIFCEVKDDVYSNWVVGKVVKELVVVVKEVVV